MRFPRLFAGLTAACALSLSFSAAPVKAQAGGDATIASVKGPREVVRIVTKAAAGAGDKYKPGNQGRGRLPVVRPIANASALFCNTATGMTAATAATRRIDLRRPNCRRRWPRRSRRAITRSDDHCSRPNEPVELFGRSTRIGAWLSTTPTSTSTTATSSPTCA
jgi:hypothetical protein